MKNQVYSGTPTNQRFAKCPSTVKSGDAVLIGAEPAIALNDYQANLAGATFYFGGSFNVTVIGATVISPQTGHAVNPGDKVYYDGGSLDAATNVTTGGSIDVNSSTGTFFGYLDASYVGITSGTTDTAAVVRLAGAE